MRYHINDSEFLQWRDSLVDWAIAENSTERLYGLWVEGYSTWEAEAILG